jgi:TRAP-type C4-dicarboxylate transport system permease small subunit
MTRVLTRLTAGFDWLAGWVVLASMVLVAGNVLMRALLGSPIGGTYELTGFLTALAVSLALAHCAMHGGHTVITLAVDRLPHRVRKLDRVLVRILTATFLALAAWRVFVYAGATWNSGEVAPTTKTPIHPFMYIVAGSLVLYSLVEWSKVLGLILVKEKEEAEYEHYVAFAPHDACPVPAEALVAEGENAGARPPAPGSGAQVRPPASAGPIDTLPIAHADTEEPAL